MYNNVGLTKSRLEKNDEFYTPYEVIEKEVEFHKDRFIGKTVFCNCDNPHTSNFATFFIKNFELLKIKRLICIGYDENNNGVLFDTDNCLTIGGLGSMPTLKLNTGGDFRSEESLSYLKQADIVVTNPPFSLFRDLFQLLTDYQKEFLIMGNLNAVDYKVVFPFIKNGDVRLGDSIHSGDTKFYVPDNYSLNASTCGIDSNGRKYIRVKGIRWFTTFPYSNHMIILPLLNNYYGNESYYPKYDNYDAININRVRDIPGDYFDIMGVPITYMDKHCPRQFEILDTALTLPIKPKRLSVGGKEVYKRIFIRRIPK